jgi:hypothetical protein
LGDSPASIGRISTRHHPLLADASRLGTASIGCAFTRHHPPISDASRLGTASIGVTKGWHIDPQPDELAAAHLRLTLDRYTVGTDGTFDWHQRAVFVHRLAIEYRPADSAASEHAHGFRTGSGRRWLRGNLTAPAGTRCAWS